MLNSLQNHSSSSLPFVNCFVHTIPTGPPQYIIPTHTCFDFTSLLRDSTSCEANTSISSIPVSNYARLRNTLHSFRDMISLDDTQIEALSSVFSQSIALIQGYVFTTNSKARATKLT